MDVADQSGSDSDSEPDAYQPPSQAENQEEEQQCNHDLDHLLVLEHASIEMDPSMLEAAANGFAEIVVGANAAAEVELVGSCALRLVLEPVVDIELPYLDERDGLVGFDDLDGVEEYVPYFANALVEEVGEGEQEDDHHEDPYHQAISIPAEPLAGG